MGTGVWANAETVIAAKPQKSNCLSMDFMRCINFEMAAVKTVAVKENNGKRISLSLRSGGRQVQSLNSAIAGFAGKSGLSDGSKFQGRTNQPTRTGFWLPSRRRRRSSRLFARCPEPLPCRSHKIWRSGQPTGGSFSASPVAKHRVDRRIARLPTARRWQFRHSRKPSANWQAKRLP